MQALISCARNKNAVQNIMKFLADPKNQDIVSVDFHSTVDKSVILNNHRLLQIAESLRINRLFEDMDVQQVQSLASTLILYVNKIHLSKELALKPKLNTVSCEMLKSGKAALESICSFFRKEGRCRIAEAFEHYTAVVDRLATFLDAVPRKPKSGEVYAVMSKLIPSDNQLRFAQSTHHASVMALCEEEDSSVQKFPTREAWNEARLLVDALIEEKRKIAGTYPRKVVVNIWGGEFKRSKGRNLAECLYLLGVEPVWDSAGIVHDIRRIPMEELKRPRIDVVAQTSGMFRDVGASRIDLINKAVKSLTVIEDDISGDNYVRESSVKAKEIMRRKGFTAEDAEEFSTVRTVGAVPGTYGTGIIPFVENGNHWNCKTMAAEAYLTYMGVIYTRKYWGMEKRGVLEALLHDADTIVQPLSNNTCGPLSLDHIYEYVGGVSAAISYITGNKPDAFIHSIIEKNNPKVISIENAVEEEKRDSFCNPFYIRRVMEGETASTKALARTFRNTFGWNVLRPSVLSESMWAELFSLYVDDSAGIGIGRYFEEINPHGFQEITGILLEAARKQFWCPDTDACTELAVRHAQSVVAHEMVSNSFVTDNPALIEMIKVYLPESLLNGYSKKIDLKENDRDNQFDHIKEMLGSSMAAMVSVMILTVLFAGSFVVYLCGERTTSQEVT